MTYNEFCGRIAAYAALGKVSRDALEKVRAIGEERWNWFMELDALTAGVVFAERFERALASDDPADQKAAGFVLLGLNLHADEFVNKQQPAPPPRAKGFQWEITKEGRA